MGRLSWVTQVDSTSSHEASLAAEKQTDGAGERLPPRLLILKMGMGPQEAVKGLQCTAG